MFYPMHCTDPSGKNVQVFCAGADVAVVVTGAAVVAGATVVAGGGGGTDDGVGGKVMVGTDPVTGGIAGRIYPGNFDRESEKNSTGNSAHKTRNSGNASPCR